MIVSSEWRSNCYGTKTNSQVSSTSRTKTVMRQTESIRTLITSKRREPINRSRSRPRRGRTSSSLLLSQRSRRRSRSSRTTVEQSRMISTWASSSPSRCHLWSSLRSGRLQCNSQQVASPISRSKPWTSKISKHCWTPIICWSPTTLTHNRWIYSLIIALLEPLMD